MRFFVYFDIRPTIDLQSSMVTSEGLEQISEKPMFMRFFDICLGFSADFSPKTQCIGRTMFGMLKNSMPSRISIEQISSSITVLI